MLPSASERSQRHPFLHVSFSNGFGLVSVHPPHRVCRLRQDNAVAERVNNTIKNELLKGMTFTCIEEVQKAVEIAICFYNEERPHMSLDGMTPREAATRTGEINKKWISYREKAIKAKVV